MGLCLYACRPLLSCYHPYLVCIHFGSHPYIFLHFSECVSFLVSVLSDVTLDLIGVSSFAVTSLQRPETSPSCFCGHRWVLPGLLTLADGLLWPHLQIFTCLSLRVTCACSVPILQWCVSNGICVTMHANYPASIFKNCNLLLFAKPELTDGIALFPGVPWVWERGYIWDTYDCNRHGTWFWDCATKCGKDDKRYVERVPGSERGFERLTEREDVVVSRDGYSLLRYSRCFPVLTDLAVDFTG